MDNDKPRYEELLKENEILKKELVEKKNLEKELAKTRILMQTAFDQSPVPLMVVTYPDFTFRIINKATEEFLLVKASNYLNKIPTEIDWTWKEYYPDGTPVTSIHELPLPMAMQGISTKNKEMYISRHDGSIVWELASASPIYDNEGNLIGGILAITDITERKKTEQILKEKENKLKEQNEEYEALNEELKEANSQLIIAIEKAEESDRLKTAFLQNMSHEIRTPMNAIIGFSSFLNDDTLLSNKRKNFTSIIINSANQLLSIVTDILTISSLETHQEKFNIQKVSINNILENLLAVFKIQTTTHNVLLYTNQALPDNQSLIYTDEIKLTQVLTNLLSNAVKFTHEGSIEFGYELKNDMLEFFVKDTGIGIYIEQQEKIFERFHQADKSIHYNYGGTGLGLSISKGFVELLGGKIWVKSEINKGSTFFFTIPYNPIEETINDKNAENKNLNAKTVLVAEDEIYNFLFIEEILNKFGVNVIHTKNGYETVELIKTNQLIDLILMDIKMPIMDGHAAAQIIRTLRPKLPIIAQSAYALEHEKIRYSGIAFDDYITKPINPEKIKELLMKYIDK